MAKLILWILIVSNCGLCVRASADALAVVGYLPDYRIDEVRPVQLSGLTDLVYFSLQTMSRDRHPRRDTLPRWTPRQGLRGVRPEFAGRATRAWR